jgi:hypothetical protein
MEVQNPLASQCPLQQVLLLSMGQSVSVPHPKPMLPMLQAGPPVAGQAWVVTDWVQQSASRVARSTQQVPAGRQRQWPSAQRSEPHWATLVLRDRGPMPGLHAVSAATPPRRAGSSPP